MATGRLAIVRKKLQMIDRASKKTQQAQSMRRRSGEITPRSVPA
jgi:hypothetical protein